MPSSYTNNDAVYVPAIYIPNLILIEKKGGRTGGRRGDTFLFLKLVEELG